MVELEQLIEEYRGEVYAAASSFHTWKNINSLALKNPALALALQLNARSWNIIQYSLQSTFLTALGRLFDSNDKSLSIATFIKACETGIDQFGKGALESRRLESNQGVRPAYLDTLLQHAQEPNQADFQILSAKLSEWEAIYREKYKPIRNKMIAHRDMKVINNTESLFAKTEMDEIEAILQFAFQVSGVIEQFFNDGRKSELTDHVSYQEQYIRKDLENLLSKIVD